MCGRWCLEPLPEGAFLLSHEQKTLPKRELFSVLVSLRESIWNQIFLNLYENGKGGVERPRNGG